MKMAEFTKLKKELQKIKDMGWILCSQNNFGEVGLKLERLLNRNPENFEIPDYDNIEIKTKSSKTKKLITLFNAAPDSYLYEIKRLHGLYGYTYTTMGRYKVLNSIVYSKKKTYVSKGIYFSLKVLWDKKIVNLIVSDEDDNIIDNLTSWTFDLLQEKLERKLKYLCFLEVDKYFNYDRMYIKYSKDNYYVLKGFDCFMMLLEQGIISITFRIGVFKTGKRMGQIHDHGTSFSIHEKDLERLFDKLL